MPIHRFRVSHLYSPSGSFWLSIHSDFHYPLPITSSFYPSSVYIPIATIFVNGTPTTPLPVLRLCINSSPSTQRASSCLPLPIRYSFFFHFSFSWYSRLSSHCKENGILSSYRLYLYMAASSFQLHCPSTNSIEEAAVQDHTSSY